MIFNTIQIKRKQYEDKARNVQIITWWFLFIPIYRRIEVL